MPATGRGHGPLPQEIARMAGGESVGSATLAHARELLASRAQPPV